MPRKRNRNQGLGRGGTVILSFLYSVFRFWILRVDEARALQLGNRFASMLLAVMKKKCVVDYQKFFGTIDPQRDEKLYAAYVSFIGRTFVENIRDNEVGLETFRERSELQGREHIDEALKRGKGVMLLGSHLGNFYAYHQVLSLHGYRLTNVSEKISIPSMEAQVDRLRRRFNVTSVFVDKNAARIAIKTFRKNQIFSVIFEVAVRQDKAVTLPFGAACLDSDLGPALLAVRFGVPVLPVTIHSDRPFNPRVHVQSPFPAPQGDTEEQRAFHLLKMWRDWLQDEVVKRPEQWWPWFLADVHMTPGENTGFQPPQFLEHAAHS